MPTPIPFHIPLESHETSGALAGSERRRQGEGVDGRLEEGVRRRRLHESRDVHPERQRRVRRAGVDSTRRSSRRAIEKHFKLKVVGRGSLEGATAGDRQSEPVRRHRLRPRRVPDSRPAEADHLDRIDADTFAPEEFTAHGNDCSSTYRTGWARRSSCPYISRRIGVDMTVRNWRTVTKLCEMVSGT